MLLPTLHLASAAASFAATRPVIEAARAQRPTADGPACPGMGSRSGETHGTGGGVYCGGSYKGNQRPNSLVVEPSKCEIRTFAGNQVTRLSVLAWAGHRAVPDTSGSHCGPR